jgi:hypothetical protein
MAVRDHAMLNTIDSVGRIRWPNPLAESVGRIRWPVSPPFSSGVVASVVASYCSLRMPAGKPFPLAEHIEDECENRIKGTLKATPISCCCPCVPAISRIGMRNIFVLISPFGGWDSSQIVSTHHTNKPFPSPFDVALQV